MVVCSPWSRGGAVCSQVFDHTSVIQLIERVLARRTGGRLRETNITPWRRAVCGDMTSLFRPAAPAETGAPDAGPRDAYIEKIHEARFRGLPTGYRAWGAADLADLRAGRPAGGMPRVEPGTRPSCPLPYELEVNGRTAGDRSGLEVELRAGRSLFGARAAGAPFQARAWDVEGGMAVRHYAVAAGAAVQDLWRFDEFDGGLCRLAVLGPNGFLREFVGRAESAAVAVRIRSVPEGQGAPAVLVVDLANAGAAEVSVGLQDHAYGTGTRTVTVPAGGEAQVRVDATGTGGWYDFTVAVTGGWSVRAAGRVETGAWSTSDPAMGRV
jgi:phospholipase C